MSCASSRSATGWVKARLTGATNSGSSCSSFSLRPLRATGAVGFLAAFIPTFGLEEEGSLGRQGAVHTSAQLGLQRAAAWVPRACSSVSAKARGWGRDGRTEMRVLRVTGAKGVETSSRESRRAKPCLRSSSFRTHSTAHHTPARMREDTIHS